jgi:hypothetical protein
MSSTQQGATTTAWAAVAKDREGKEERYLAECEEAPKGDDHRSLEGVGFVPHTYDEEKEGRLWRDSLEMVGML